MTTYTVTIQLPATKKLPPGHLTLNLKAKTPPTAIARALRAALKDRPNQNTHGAKIHLHHYLRHQRQEEQRQDQGAKFRRIFKNQQPPQPG